jgi:hypothetical protein
MSDKNTVVSAYHRALAREKAKSGVSWPLVRLDCVQDDGTITDTNVYSPQIVATWALDSIGRVRVTLV